MRGIFSRRWFLKGAPVAAAAAPMAVGMIADKIAGGGIGSLNALGSGYATEAGQQDMAIPTPAYGDAATRAVKDAFVRITEHPDMRAARDLVNAAYSRQQIAEEWRRRHGGLDPEIAAMRSLSQSARCRMQLRRNDERQKAISVLEKQTLSLQETLIGVLGLGGILGAKNGNGPSIAPTAARILGGLRA